jgi:hypothetical protein
MHVELQISPDRNSGFWLFLSGTIVEKCYNVQRLA